jgi:hypothetical protein
MYFTGMSFYYFSGLSWLQFLPADYKSLVSCGAFCFSVTWYCSKHSDFPGSGICVKESDGQFIVGHGFIV